MLNPHFAKVWIVPRAQRGTIVALPPPRRTCVSLHEGPLVTAHSFPRCSVCGNAFPGAGRPALPVLYRYRMAGAARGAAGEVQGERAAEALCRARKARRHPGGESPREHGELSARKAVHVVIDGGEA